MSIPGYTAHITLYKTSKHYFTGKTFINAAFTMGYVPAQLAQSPTGTTIARYGCSECVLYTEPGPTGRSAGIRTCCSLTCRTTIFGAYRCYEYCSQEVCATFPPGVIIV